MGLSKVEKKQLRKKVLVDKSMQFKLAGRLIGYWVGVWALIIIFPFVASLAFRATSTPLNELLPSMIDDFWFPIVMSTLVLPIVARDSIRFSHRIAGPLFRMKRELKNLADGNETKEVRFRDGDFCQDLASEFSRVVRKFGNQNQA